MENLLGVDIEVLNDTDEPIAYAAFTVTGDITTLELYPSLAFTADTEDFTAIVPSVVTYEDGAVSGAEPLDATHPFADPDVLIVFDSIYDDATAQAWAASENITLLKLSQLRVLPYDEGQRVSGTFGYGVTLNVPGDAVDVLGDDGETYVIETTGLTLA